MAHLKGCTETNTLIIFVIPKKKRDNQNNWERTESLLVKSDRVVTEEGRFELYFKRI